MNKIVKLGMTFDTANAPSFGSIEENPDYPGEYTLLAADISKLNSLLTKSALSAYLANDSEFAVKPGANAIVADEPAVWRYHGKSDRWYEVISND